MSVRTSTSVALSVGLGLSLVGGNALTPASAASSRYISYNAHNHTAKIILIGALNNSNQGMNFDGYANGKAIFTVPLGTKVTVAYSDGASKPHSAEIAPWSASIPAAAVTPAFKGAASADYANGSEKGDPISVFTFTASKAGKYRIMCGVTAHAILGMWDVLQVSKSAKVATLN